MKKVISFLLIFIFIFTLYGWSGEQSGEASGDASGNASSEVLVTVVLIVAAVYLIIAAFGGIASTKISQTISKNKKKDKEKEEVALLFNEISSPTELTPNLDILAKMYNFKTNEVKDVICRLVDNGYIDIEKSFEDNNEAIRSIKMISIALKNKALKENRLDLQKIHAINNWFKQNTKEGKEISYKDILYLTKLLIN